MIIITKSCAMIINKTAVSLEDYYNMRNDGTNTMVHKRPLKLFCCLLVKSPRMAVISGI